MRIRATVAAVSGALALSALAVPAAQADDSRPASGGSSFTAPQPTQGSQTKRTAGVSAKAAKAAKVKITSVVVNGGKPIVLGAKAKKTVSFSSTATGSGLIGTAPFIWVGKNVNSAFGVGPNEKGFTCKAVNATTTTCKGTITVNPAELKNAQAANWHVGVVAVTEDGEEIQKDSVARIKVQRLGQLTVNASPEPVKKGKTITVTGKLTRANWETKKYAGYGAQSVKLQFLKKGAKSWATVKTVKGSSTGTLKTTVKASADGYWRYSFAGTASTSAVSSTGDFVDVK
ncbi:calcium-binding protein [Streptomyces cyaneofuscatus]